MRYIVKPLFCLFIIKYFVLYLLRQKCQPVQKDQEPHWQEMLNVVKIILQGASKKTQFLISQKNNRNKCTNQNRIHLDSLGISYNNTVRGSFHRGDVQFSAESRGVQCSCNALVMLCKIDEFAQNITPARLDNVLRHGDELYRNIAQKLLESGQLARSGYLELEQLPSNVSVGNLVFKN